MRKNIKKIILVVGSLELGGAEKQALLFARYLQLNSEYSVQIRGFNSPGRLTRLCDQYGIEWKIDNVQLSSNPLILIRNLFRFSMTLRKEKPDVIIAYTNYPNVLCGLIWRFTGATKFVWNQRDTGIERSTRILERFAILNTRCFISNSDQVFDFMTQSLNINKKRIQIVKNGIEFRSGNADRSEWRKKIGLSEECKLVCMIGNLSLHKDHETLLKAWRIVIDRFKYNQEQTKLILAGRFDKNYYRLKQLAFDLDIEDSVEFLGEIEDISGLLSAVDLGAFSSYSEGMPNAVLECMAAGLAVVATDIPSIREALGPDGSRYLFTPGDFQTMAEMILVLIESEELRKSAGRRNSNRISQLFDPNTMIEKMVQIVNN